MEIRESGTKSHSTYIAFGGLTVALNGALMLTLGMIPWVNSYVVILLVLTLVPMVYEFGPKKALPVWLATTVLLFFIMPAKDFAFLYFFDGYVPAVYPRFKTLTKRQQLFCEFIMAVVPGLVMALLLKLVIADEPLELFGLRIFGFWPNFIYGTFVFFLVIWIELKKMGSWFALYERKGRPLMKKILKDL